MFSDLNKDTAYLIYAIITRISMNIGSTIYKKIEEFVLLANPRNTKHKGSLGFLSFITSLCRSRGVQVNRPHAPPYDTIRQPINQLFILDNYTLATPMVVDDAPPAEPATIANPLLAQYQTVHEAKMREMHVAIATNNCAISIIIDPLRGFNLHSTTGA